MGIRDSGDYELVSLRIPVWVWTVDSYGVAGFILLEKRIKGLSDEEMVDALQDMAWAHFEVHDEARLEIEKRAVGSNGGSKNGPKKDASQAEGVG